MAVQHPTHFPEIGKCEVQTYSVCVEPTAGYWTNNAKFGQRFQGSLPAVEGQIINLIDNPRLPGPPSPWAVNLFRSNKNIANEASPTQNADIRARITYGAGGASNQFDCDVLAGMQFELVCNAIRIDLVSYNPIPGIAYDPGPGLIVGALIGKGTGSASLPVTYTSPFFNGTDVAPSQQFAIPDFARSFCFHGESEDPADYATTLIVLSGAGPLKTINVQEMWQELQLERGLALPGGVNQAAVVTGAFTGNFALQWFLAL